MLKIRKATIADAEILAENNLLLADESENIKLDYETTLKGVKEVICDKSKGFIIVAEENNKIIGQTMITFEWSDWYNKNIWWLQSVYVKKPYRKKEVFSKILNYVKKIANEKEIDTLRLYVHNDNINAMKAYEKTNFEKRPYSVYQIEIVD